MAGQLVAGDEFIQVDDDPYHPDPAFGGIVMGLEILE